MSSTTQNSSDAGNTKMLGSSVTVLILGDSKGQVLMPSPKCMIKESRRMLHVHYEPTMMSQGKGGFTGV